MSGELVLSADEFISALEGAGITHVMGIPDNRSAPLFDRLLAHDSIHLVTVSREGEAFAIASGIWMGGGRPFVVVQNTGLLEAGDALRGTASRMGVPLPIMITGRGYEKMARAGLGPGVALDSALVTRPDVDSVALHTEPTLDAWGVPFQRAETETDLTKLYEILGQAEKEQRPVALVLAQRLI